MKKFLLIMALMTFAVMTLALTGCQGNVPEAEAPVSTAQPTDSSASTEEPVATEEPIASEEPATVESYTMEDMTDIDLYGDKLSLSNVDFSKQPAFKTEEGMFAFIEDCLSKKCRNIVFTCDRAISLGLSAQEFCEKYHVCWTNPKMQPGEFGKHFVITVTYYPGDDVSWAYVNEDTSRLSEKETELYTEAVRWLQENIREDMSQEEQCTVIHDYLAGTVQYDEELFKALNSSFTFDWGITAYGAMIDHNTICQGYADAFYMLTTMLGMEGTQVVGTGSGEPHNWNQIKISENWYFVDCTFDDAFAGNDGTSSKAYLFISGDRLKKTHKWDESAYEEAEDDSLWYYSVHDAVVTDTETLSNKIGAALEAGDEVNLLLEGISQSEVRTLMDSFPEANFHMSDYLDDLVFVAWGE